ncbi:hypothetical protein WCU81_17470 [Pectobacterium atrosepticum]|uniref:hypothetical protein n=1 Tax=Pectobacterium atrosepticum TaxID=29471 RepID=UPI00039CB5DE|nr:hypothetical protein [Pectobacterium atrosepticum]GKV87031.1 hypothetical protein PEC301296_33420 [Pectobacterium carotovorum subsp. carotovorum]AIA72676.1 hypothetical protein EV46_19355 [Pectobacterium atrosepticum]AIK15659.1 putative exported protein [Pectobacterium atrosepticum]ATY92397.1 hypothetical protein CVS35_19605 [Pectobacterium atrosepticum]KFX11419.1 hypothetical protein JV34_20875 [Pectobacterium atrosepticum]
MKYHRLNLYLAAAGLVFCMGSAFAETSVSVEVKDIGKLQKKGTVSLFDAPNSMQADAGSYYKFHKAENEGVVVITPNASSAQTDAKSAQKKSLSSNQALANDSSFTPLCPTLSVNSIYTLDGLQSGGSACYHFEITQRSKTTAFVVGMSPETDIALSLMRDDGQNNVTAINYSDQEGNADEATLDLTQPGHYYWFMEAKTADGSGFNFGAIVNTDVDAYELNDIPSLAFPLPDNLNKIEANSDSDSDADYYVFTAIRGQQVLLSLNGLTSGTNNNWLLASSADGGNTWTTRNTGQEITITPSQLNEKILVRVLPNPSRLPTVSQKYKLTLGSKIARFSHSVSGESTVLRIPNAAPTAYGFMTTQAYRDVTWQVTLADSTGAGIPNIVVILRLNQRENNGILDFGPNTDHGIITGANGSASGSVKLDNCYADYTTQFQDYSQGYINTWRTTYDVGGWRIEIPDQSGVGVGGNNSTHVTFGHICKQTLLKSVKS